MNKLRFRRFVWVTLVYTLFVILWGAFVRATGSGAGCGSHWPSCNGVVIPRPENVETVVEFTHRLTSAFSGVLVLAMLFWGFRLFDKGHLVRKATAVTFIFILTEGLIGALLVRLELVGGNQSVARAVMIAVHLVNTFLLIAAMALSGWWARETAVYWPKKIDRLVKTFLWIGAAGFLLLGASGAITALGDTLFPSASLLEGFQQDINPTANFLIRLRIYHPIIGLLLGLYLLFATSALRERFPFPAIQRLTLWVRWLFLAQMLLGIVNVLLLAPIWMQLLHLLLADMVWITAVLFGAELISLPSTVTAAPSLQTGD